MLHDPKTVIGSDFDQETAEKIAPPFILTLDLANCITLRKKPTAQQTKHFSYSYTKPE